MLVSFRTVGFLMATALLLVQGGFAEQATENENPKLIVLLEPSSGGFTPLEGKSRPPVFELPQKPVYDFLVMAVDRDHPPESAYTYARGLVSPGETRKVQSERGAVQVRGTISMTAPGVAKYDVELLMSGRLTASAGAILNFPPSK